MVYSILALLAALVTFLAPINGFAENVENRYVQGNTTHVWCPAYDSADKTLLLAAVTATMTVKKIAATEDGYWFNGTGWSATSATVPNALYMDGLIRSNSLMTVPADATGITLTCTATGMEAVAVVYSVEPSTAKKVFDESMSNPRTPGGFGEHIQRMN